MGYKNIRDWLALAEADGELKHIRGASCDLEMSALAEIIHREGKKPLPALMFDDIPGYPKGYRTLFGMNASVRRLARTLGLSDDNKIDEMGLVSACMRQGATQRYIAPRFVKTGPILENVLTGDKVDITKFPAPKFHEFDGGRYIGTAVAVIQRDPDNGWVNLGTYRCMVVDHNRFTLHIVENRHGRFILDEKYWARGKAMPVAIGIGVEPALFHASAQRIVPWNVSEYDFAGGIKGEPIEVIESPYSGLPLPAQAEIVIEGECHPGEMVEEGPFGEWHGYYANLGLSTVPEPVVRVKAIFHRNDPILTCMPPSAPPNEQSLYSSVTKSAALWARLERFDLPGIKGVWCHPVGSGTLFNVVSIQQRYMGHAMQVGLVASQAMTQVGTFTVLVDDDIDPHNLFDVMWAVATRVDPERDIRILPRCTSASDDPCVPLEEKKKYPVAPKPLFKSRAVINACRPLEQKAGWYPVARVSPGLRQQILDKWQSVVKDLLDSNG